MSSVSMLKAGHCVQNKNQASLLPVKNLRVLLGCHDLSDEYEEGRIFS